MSDDNTAPSRPPQLVSRADALERLLPHFENNPHKVAKCLDDLQQTGDILLLGVVEMPPNSNPGMLGVKARFSPSGEPELYVEKRGSVGWDRTYQDWAFGGEGFEAHFPGAPKNRGGRPRAYKREDILIEGAMVAFEDGVPGTFEAFWGAVEARLGDASPGETLLKESLGPLYKRLEGSTHRR